MQIIGINEILLFILNSTASILIYELNLTNQPLSFYDAAVTCLTLVTVMCKGKENMGYVFMELAKTLVLFRIFTHVKGIKPRLSYLVQINKMYIIGMR